MDFDTFMGQPQTIQDRISHQLHKAERLKNQCEAATVVYGDIKVQSSGENKRELWLTKYIDSKRELTDLMEEYDRVTEEVRSWLYENLSGEAASMLEYKYIDGLKYPELAEAVHYAYQTTRTKMSHYIREARALYEKQKGDN